MMAMNTDDGVGVGVGGGRDGQGRTPSRGGVGTRERGVAPII